MNLRTFTTTHTARLPTDPTYAITADEIEDLRWFWHDAEALCGVRSTIGAMLERQAAKTMSEELARELASIRREVTKLRRESRLPPEPEPQTMYVRKDSHEPSSDPFEDDAILGHVRRTNRIRARLLRCMPHDRVLFAVYGPGRGDRELLRKRFGDFGEVAVAIVASQRVDGDPPARHIVDSKLSDDSFVRVMVHAAGGYVRAACQAYAGTR